MTSFSQKNKTSVSIEIENIRLRQDCSYLEAMISWAEKNSFDLEDMKEVVSEVLIEKLRSEQVELNAVKSEKAASTGSLDQWL